ncbi:NUDIX domain-containing protein [Actinomycetospora soli]|uniref:NUDIX domain-containing protein n=1 Tax=Actinomycetospora soli TaxID=2893887 RepID=UPI001E299F7A|nr:NUDIX domain-containing protein [Actinomycetospora soli]MCD2191685.1 NUDIX domain-containing protein [Actinomycetospora soli]
MAAGRLVGTGKAADALGIARTTLARWVAAGHVTPAHQTIGGHMRWDLDDLQRQIAALTGREATPMTASPETPVDLPVVAAVVTSERGMLVTWRNDKTPPAGFLTGEIEPGESPADAMVRECKEEAGLLVAADREVFRRVHPKTGRTMIYVAGHPTGDLDVSVTDDYELAAVRWVSLAEADDSFAPFGGMAREVHEHLERALSS